MSSAVNLYSANKPGTFWRLLVEPCVSPVEWAEALHAATPTLLPLEAAAGGDGHQIVADVLGEAGSGPNRWQLSPTNRLYYQLKTFVPRSLRIALRRHYRKRQESASALGWPIEDRYVRFLNCCVAHVLGQRGLGSVPYVGFWPHGHSFALVLTHDVEDEQGAAFVPTLADLEETLGFRSVFNFVPERYAVEPQLLADLQRRGFEIGLHDLKHDGKLFSSRRVFERRAVKINDYAQRWGAVGFRAPYMHRNPEWLQALEVEYDLSFFDTDPYEPMPGGTMSLWPFFLGRFVELPYTLVQDHTLMIILRERTPRLWLDKVRFIEQSKGMALLNTHPDYLAKPAHLAIYEGFLKEMKQREGYWHALPREVARWWRRRSEMQAHRHDGQWDLSELPGATVSMVLGS